MTFAATEPVAREVCAKPERDELQIEVDSCGLDRSSRPCLDSKLGEAHNQPPYIRVVPLGECGGCVVEVSGGDLSAGGPAAPRVEGVDSGRGRGRVELPAVEDGGEVERVFVVDRFIVERPRIAVLLHVVAGADGDVVETASRHVELGAASVQFAAQCTAMTQRRFAEPALDDAMPDLGVGDRLGGCSELGTFGRSLAGDAIELRGGGGEP